MWSSSFKTGRIPIKFHWYKHIFNSFFQLSLLITEDYRIFRVENQQLHMRKLRLEVSNSTNLQWRQAALLRALLDIWLDGNQHEPIHVSNLLFTKMWASHNGRSFKLYTMHYASNSNWFENSCLKSLQIHFLGFPNLKFTGGHAPRLPSKLQIALA